MTQSYLKASEPKIACTPCRGGLSIDDMVLGPNGAGDENMCLERASANYVCKVRGTGWG